MRPDGAIAPSCCVVLSNPGFGKWRPHCDFTQPSVARRSDTTIHIRHTFNVKGMRLAIALGILAIVIAILWRSWPIQHQRRPNSATSKTPQPVLVRKQDIGPETLKSPTVDASIATYNSPTYGGGLDRSVIGRSFALTDAAMASCNRSSHACSGVPLTRFSQEPRDLDWAPRAELGIADIVENNRSGKFLLDNIECRQDLCIVEVSSQLGAFPGLSYSEQRGLNLSGGIGWNSISHDPASSISTTATVLVYQRLQ
jgi:hypothetical protein